MLYRTVAPWLATSALLFGSTAFALPVAHLELQSEPGDSIGQGGTYDLFYDNSFGTLYAQIRRRLDAGQPAELVFILDDAQVGGADYALLFFGTDQLGIPIQPGSYSDAERADFASPGHPGLDVAFQHRGSSAVTGAFTITEVTFSADLQTIVSFVASFEQHSEGRPPSLFGQFEYRAAGIVPEPGTGLLLSLGLGLFGSRNRLRRGV